MPLTRAPLRSDRNGNVLPSQAYTSFGMAAPLRTHFIELPCKVAQCERYVHGWTTTLDPGREEHWPFIQHILSGRSGRRYSRGENTPEGYMTFVFPPGQPCFRNSHHERNREVRELYVVRNGDFRTPNRQRQLRVMGFDNWLEAFDRNQTALVKGYESMRE